MVSAADETPAIADVRSVLEDVRDPEIPILTIADLGILRDVAIENGEIVIVITPTYSGCPAMNTIEQDIRAALDAAGIAPVRIETRLAPAWTTDRMQGAVPLPRVPRTVRLFQMYLRRRRQYV